MSAVVFYTIAVANLLSVVFLVREAPLGGGG